MTKKRLAILIADSNKRDREILRSCLENNAHIASVDEAASTEKSLYKIIDLSPDLIFLDVGMSGGTGTELIEMLEKWWIFRDVVLMSSDKGSAVKAIKTGIYDFLLKPADNSEVNKIIEKFRLKKNKKLNTKFSNLFDNLYDGRLVRISSIGSDLLINPDDIIYCQAQGSYTMLFFENGNKQCISSYLGMFEKIISGYNFYRISRSLLINMDKLSKVNRGDNSCTLVTTSNKEIKLYGSRKQMHTLCAG